MSCKRKWNEKTGFRIHVIWCTPKSKFYLNVLYLKCPEMFAWGGCCHMLSPIISESGGRWCIAHLNVLPPWAKSSCAIISQHRAWAVNLPPQCGWNWQCVLFVVVLSSCHGSGNSNGQSPQARLKHTIFRNKIHQKYIKKRQLTWFCWTTTDESDFFTAKLCQSGEKTCTNSPGASLALCSNLMQRSRASRAKLRPEPGSRWSFHKWASASSSPKKKTDEESNTLDE